MADKVEKMDKGGVLEEVLRAYFLSQGYFAVRGVPVMYGEEDVTDIDIWLYLRPSPLSRERVNVDAKNRAKAHALERILWAKGLQHVLGFDSCIVATTDTRPHPKEYGNQHGVLVLDGVFVGWLKRNVAIERLSDEEFESLLGPSKEDKQTGDWKGRLKAAKSRLATHLGFDACNTWLADIQFFLEQSAAPGRGEAAVRSVYMLVSFLLVGIDFALRRIAFDEGDLRRKTLNEGFRYGSRGPKQLKDALGVALDLVATYDANAGSRVRAQALEHLEQLGGAAEPLAEFFSKSDIGGALFAWARALDAKAFASTFVSPGALEAPLQAVLGVLLDFFGIERTKFLK